MYTTVVSLCLHACCKSIPQASLLEKEKNLFFLDVRTYVRTYVHGPFIVVTRTVFFCHFLLLSFSAFAEDEQQYRGVSSKMRQLYSGTNFQRVTLHKRLSKKVNLFSAVLWAFCGCRYAYDSRLKNITLSYYVFHCMSKNVSKM